MKIGKPSPALVIAMLGLLIALTGTAGAAGLLVTSKQIKDGTIQTVDISKHAQAQLRAGDSAGSRIQGSWQFTATRVGVTPPTFVGYVAFTDSGSVVEVNPLNQSAGVGAWTKLANRQYRWTFTRYRFNSSGAAVATATVVETDTIDQSGNAFDGTSTLEIRDLNGALIGSGTATTHGTRING